MIMDLRTRLALAAAQAMLVNAVRVLNTAASTGDVEAAVAALEKVEKENHTHILALIRAHYANPSTPIQVAADSLRATA